jgi:hypothetical protein
LEANESAYSFENFPSRIESTNVVAKPPFLCQECLSEAGFKILPLVGDLTVLHRGRVASNLFRHLLGVDIDCVGTRHVDVEDQLQANTGQI